MHRTMALALLAVLAVGGPTANAQIRLIGITGELVTPEFGFEEGVNDETLYEINLTTGAQTRLQQLTRVPDSNSIGYNPTNGLLYHLTGSESYRNDPTRWGYNDNQYMETVDPVTFELDAIFNANGPPMTDTAPFFGLAAPRPSWVLPEERRTDEQTGPEFRQKGENEYGSARGLAWSDEEGLFYLTSGDGFFTMTPEGESTFIGTTPAFGDGPKGITFVDVGGVKKLYAGDRDNANLYEIDPETGVEVGDPIEVTSPLSQGGDPEPAGGILALATHPETNVVYAILEPMGDDQQLLRQLATINITTGLATVITNLDGAGESAFSGLAFVGFTSGSSADTDDDGDVDGADFLTLQRNGSSFTDWKSGFGGGATAAGAPVPEPSTFVVAALALGGLGIMRRRRLA